MKSPFSIHQIAITGEQFGKRIGEWFGPATISSVLQYFYFNLLILLILLIFQIVSFFNSFQKIFGFENFNLSNQ